MKAPDDCAVCAAGGRHAARDCKDAGQRGCRFPTYDCVFCVLWPSCHGTMKDVCDLDVEEGQ